MSAGRARPRVRLAPSCRAKAVTSDPFWTSREAWPPTGCAMALTSTVAGCGCPAELEGFTTRPLYLLLDTTATEPFGEPATAGPIGATLLSSDGFPCRGSFSVGACHW